MGESEQSHAQRDDNWARPAAVQASLSDVERIAKKRQQRKQAAFQEPIHIKRTQSAHSTGRGWFLLLLGMKRAWQLIYFLMALVAILTLCYLLGHTQLEGGLAGNDIPWALSQAQWYDRWFPDLAIWFPKQGAGTPLLFLYQPGTSILVVLISRWSGLDLIQAFRLLVFLSVPVTAFGVYVFVWRKLNQQTVALIAALFYPISTAAWDWQARVGLYAQSVTILFVPWALLLFDLCLDPKRHPEKPLRWRGLAFMFAAVLFGLMFLHHIPTALVFLMGISIYALLLPLYRKRHQRLLNSMFRSVLKAWAIASVGLLLIAFWLVPFVHINSLANREGLSYIPAELVSSYDWTKVLSLVPNELTNRLSFPIIIVGLAGLGITAALLRKETPLVWGVLAFGSVFFVAMPTLWPWLVSRFGLLWSATNDRAVLLAIVLLPAVAAYGASVLPHFVVHAPGALANAIRKQAKPANRQSSFLRTLKNGITSLLALSIAGAAIYYGPTIAPDHTLYALQDADEPLPLDLQQGEIELLDPPEYTISSQGEGIYHQVLPEIVERLNLDWQTRLDVSPNQGGITEALSLYSDASIINLYGFNASLLHAMWGYQSKVFYAADEGSRTELNELAKWFGIQYVIIDKGLDPVEFYEPTLWPIVYQTNGESQQGISVRSFEQAPAMVSLLTTPTVLVIGGFEHAIYEQAFTTFMKGALGYEQGLVVEGSHRIDDYRLEDLQHFDAVFMHGYGYRNREKAWQLLETYVAGGGGLYVDTGWQYFTPDWETPEAPAVLPVKDLVWTDAGKSMDYLIEDVVLSGISDAQGFGPLIWEDLPWNISAPLQGLRDWAHTVISVHGVPLIAAGEFGQGRVVWSGMNLIGHSLAYDSDPERALIGSLIAWLTPQAEGIEFPIPEVVREHPDHLRFVLAEPTQEPSLLLWREAYSPDWRARLCINGSEMEIPIYRAGPGLVLMQLPPIESSGAVVHLDYDLGWFGLIGVRVSFITLFFLMIFTVSPDLWQVFGRNVGRKRNRHKQQGEATWMREDSNYFFDKGASTADPMDADQQEPWPPRPSERNQDA